MPNFPVLTLNSAPADSKILLQQTQSSFGFIPNIIGVMATSPAVTEAYLVISSIFSKSSLTATEQQIVLLTVSYYHECRYCMAAHTVIADMQKVNYDVIKAIRDNQPIKDIKLEALRQFTVILIEKRGSASETDVQIFLDAGYETKHILDILIGIAQKTISNFTNHLAKTPLDSAFTEVAWKPEK